MIRAFFRMIRGWVTGKYRVTPWRTIGLGAVLLVYLFSPVDLIPDYIPFVGFIDDLVILGFFARSLQKDVRRFAEWEQSVRR